MSGEERLQQGQIVWVNFDPVVGSEQAGHRPAVVISSDDHLKIMDNLAIVMPITSTRRAWPNHVPVSPKSALPRKCWIMTEQPKTISRKRISSVGPILDEDCLTEARFWMDAFSFTR